MINQKIVLTINAGVLVVAGLVFAFLPDVFVHSDDHIAELMGRAFGVATLAIGFLSGLSATIDKHKHVNQLVFASLTLYHIGLTVITTIGYIEDQLPVLMPVTHSVFALLFVVLTAKNNR